MNASILQSLTPLTASDLDSKGLRILCKILNTVYCSAAIVSIYILGKYKPWGLDSITSVLLGLIVYVFIGTVFQLIRNACLSKKEEKIRYYLQLWYPEPKEEIADVAQKQDTQAEISPVLDAIDDLQDKTLSKQEFKMVMEKQFEAINLLVNKVNLLQESVLDLQKGKPGRVTLQPGEDPFLDKNIKKIFKQHMSSIKPQSINSVKGRGLVLAMCDLNTQYGFLKTYVNEESFGRWVLTEFSSKFSPGKSSKTITEKSLRTAQNFEEERNNYKKELKKQFGYK